MNYLAAAVSAAWVLTAAPALADQPVPSPTPAASPSPAPGASPTPRPWQASGFAAASYSFVQNATAFSFTDGINARAFAYQHDAPMLNAVNVQLQKNGRFGGKLELTAGTNADVIASYPDNASDGFDVTQAYLSYAAGPLTLQAGKFETLAGAEVIEDPSDANVTRSILFGYAVPFTHTGARLTFAPSSLFSVIAGINNGWDNLKGSGTGAKTGEFGLAYNGSVVSLTAQTYQGTERITNVPWSDATGHRSLIDVVGTYHVTPAVALVANYDDGRQTNAPLLDASGALVNPSGTATWNGIAGYVNWQMTPRWASSLRVEGFADNGGYRTGFDQHWSETSVTLGYSPSAQVTFRGEARYDTSNHAVFTNNAAGTPQLQGYALQALVRF